MLQHALSVEQVLNAPHIFLLVDTELMLLAHWTCLMTGKLDEATALLRQYLAEPRELDEQAWARWHLVLHCQEDDP